MTIVVLVLSLPKLTVTTVAVEQIPWIMEPILSPLQPTSPKQTHTHTKHALKKCFEYLSPNTFTEFIFWNIARSEYHHGMEI